MILNTLTCVISKFSLVALIVLFALSGCGNSDEPLTKAEFIQQGDSICRKANQKQVEGIQAYQTDRNSQTGIAAGEDLAREVGLPSLKTEIEELEDLGTPSGAEEEAQVVLTAMQSSLAKGEKDPTSILAPAGENSFAEAEKNARAFGFKICGEI